MSRSVEAADAGRSQSSSEAIAERIRCVMLTESLRPGDRLGREEDLARDFGVSRPTLREALRLLSSDHLIRASKGPGGGIFVAATPEEGISLSVSATVASMLDAQSIELGLKPRPVDDGGACCIRDVGFGLQTSVRLLVHGRPFAWCVIGGRPYFIFIDVDFPMPMLWVFRMPVPFFMPCMPIARIAWIA